MLLAMSKKCFPQFNKLPKTIVSKMNEAINKLRININGNGLNLEKIYNKYSDNLYSCRIDQEYRMILSFQQKTNTCIILWCDHHDEAYKWASNKKIDVNDITGTLQIYDVKENEIVMNNIGLRLFDKYSDEQLIAIGVPKLQLNFIRNIPSIEYFYDYKEAFSSDIYEYLELLINGNDYNEVLQLVNSLKDENVDNNYYNAAKRSSGEFAIIDDNKDLEKMNEWPLDKWRIFLHPCQKKIVKKDFFGPARVTGEAGTGKTVVAMHRAKYLLEKGNKVLFVTFTKNLCGDIENNLKKILDFDDIKNIKVKNIDSIIISYLKSNNKNRDLIYDEDKLLNYWQIAIEKSNKEIALDKHFFLEEWKSVVSLMDNLSLENYISSNRIGRKIRLDRKNRILIWQVFTNYIELMDNDNVFDIDYATFLARFLLRNENKKYYDSIIIDEGQDIISNAYKFFRLYAGDEHENDIFIVGDIHQRIYKNKAILSQCGISIRGKSNILRINYRTTQETRKFAMNILDGINFNEIDNENINTYPSVSLTHGEKPEIRNFDNLYEIANCFVEKLDKIIKDGYSLNDICVTFRKNSDINEFNAVLNEKNIATYIIDNNTKDDSNENGIRIATMHRIKGLEFRFVFIITSNLDLIKSNITNDDEIIERCLLYVAITRAQIKAYIFNNKDEKKEDETNNTNVDFEYIDENGTIKLIRCINEKECIILPEIIDGKKVETIGENCFKSLKKIKEIKFSNSIKYIEKMAFRNCSSLSNIELSDNIIEIGNNAFSGCKKLDSIILKSNNVLFSEKIINGTKKIF